MKFLTLCVLAAMGLSACGKKDAEVSVPHVEVVEQPKISQTEEEKEAELGLETAPRTVLGQEEVTVMEGEEPKTVLYTRVRGFLPGLRRGNLFGGSIS